jgi:hypothetical protein
VGVDDHDLAVLAPDVDDGPDLPVAEERPQPVAGDLAPVAVGERDLQPAVARRAGQLNLPDPEPGLPQDLAHDVVGRRQGGGHDGLEVAGDHLSVAQQHGLGRQGSDVDAREDHDRLITFS